MPVIRTVTVEDSVTRHLFWCPGCQTHMWIDDRWSWNVDYEMPTINGSVLWQGQGPNGPQCCHLFVTAGTIRFLEDCTHSLAGQTVPMEQLDW